PLHPPISPTTPRPPISPLFPYTTLFRSSSPCTGSSRSFRRSEAQPPPSALPALVGRSGCRMDHPHSSGISGRRTAPERDKESGRSEEHTSELQSLRHLVCRLLLEKKKKV